MIITNRNLAEEYARLFHLSPQAADETGAAFRERVARSIHAQGERIYAQEALYNERMSDNPFASGSLDSGYGDKSITEMAELSEATYQYLCECKRYQQRRNALPWWLRWVPLPLAWREWMAH